MINQKRSLVLNMMLSAVFVMTVSGCDKSEGIVSREDMASDTLTSITAEVMDIELAHAVKVALAEQVSLADVDIVVIAKNGEVRLSGVVDNQEQHDQALRAAIEVAGVDAVDDKIEVKQQN
ncbi:MAG: BON domain-containing protein [Pseudomonadota bacterium]|nr:BON domain-containing protein [Pseudomonadota bacterium]